MIIILLSYPSNKRASGSCTGRICSLVAWPGSNLMVLWQAVFEFFVEGILLLIVASFGVVGNLFIVIIFSLNHRRIITFHWWEQLLHFSWILCENLHNRKKEFYSIVQAHDRTFLLRPYLPFLFPFHLLASTHHTWRCYKLRLHPCHHIPSSCSPYWPNWLYFADHLHGNGEVYHRLLPFLQDKS